MISLWIRCVMPVASLLLLSLLAACDGDSEHGGEATPSPTVELTGPNANLSNAELLKKAVANMRALKSYHFEFKGGIPDDYTMMSQNLRISGDIQLNGKGSRVQIRDAASGIASAPNPDKVILEVGGVDMIILPEERPYESYDGGKMWYRWGVDTPAVYLLALFGPPFGSVWNPDGHVTIKEETVNRLLLKDGTPAVEQIDGPYMRHMVADAKGLEGQESTLLSNLLYGAKTMSFWVSTDATPTVRQMWIEGSNVVHKENRQPTDTPYTLTWKWSHFNEDFGEVKPPPPETVKSP